MGSITIRQALQQVADYPVMVTDEVVNMHVHELVARSLFDIANRPDQAVRGSMSRANKARKMILDRLAGKRRPGTKPVTPNMETLDFFDLTGGELGGQEAKPAEGVQ